MSRCTLNGLGGEPIMIVTKYAP
eukprot:COSAG05_NODE_16784_length_339_cov_0.641667_1_plen_22_part_10